MSGVLSVIATLMSEPFLSTERHSGRSATDDENVPLLISTMCSSTYFLLSAPDWHPAPQALKDACARAAAFCADKGYPIEKLAIQFSTSLNPRIATTLFSSANPANVQKNIDFVNDPIDGQLVKEVQRIIGDQMGARWKNS